MVLHSSLLPPGLEMSMQMPPERAVTVSGRDCEVCARLVYPREVQAGGPRSIHVLGQVSVPSVSLPTFSISISRASKPDFQAAIRSWFAGQDWGFGLNWLRDRFRDAFAPVIGGVMDTMWGAIRTTQVNLVQSAIRSAVGGLVSGTQSALQGTFDQITQAINTEIISRVQAQAAQLTTQLNQVAGSLQSQIEGLAGTITTEVQNQVQASISVLTEQIPGLVQTQVQGALDVFTVQLPALIQEQAGPAIAAATSALDFAFQQVQAGFGALSEQVQGLAGTVAATVEAIPGQIQDALTQAANFTMAQITAVRDQLLGAIDAAIGGLNELIIVPLRDALQVFMDQVGAALENLRALAQSALDTANEALAQAGAALAAVSEAFTGFGGALVGAFQWLQANWPFVVAGVVGVGALVVLGPPIAKVLAVRQVVRPVLGREVEKVRVGVGRPIRVAA